MGTSESEILGCAGGMRTDNEGEEVEGVEMLLRKELNDLCFIHSMGVKLGL
jgi:hypothetical protein